MRSSKVPRARPSILHQKCLRPIRPRRPDPSLEPAHARQTRIHLPRHVRHPDRQVLSLQPSPHLRWLLLWAGPPLGHTFTLSSSGPKNSTHRLGPHPPSLQPEHRRHPQRPQYRLHLYRRRPLLLEHRHALRAPGIHRTHRPRLSTDCKPELRPSPPQLQHYLRIVTAGKLPSNP